MGIKEDIRNCRNRRVTEKNFSSLDSILPELEISANTAVFCGSGEKRTDVLLHCIENNIRDRKPVIVLYSEEDMLAALERLCLQYNAELTGVSGMNPVYEPFLGMPEDDICRLLLGENSDENNSLVRTFEKFCEALGCMELPVCLDTLRWITKLKKDELKAELLSFGLDGSVVDEYIENFRTEYTGEESNVYRLRVKLNGLKRAFSGRLCSRDRDEQHYFENSICRTAARGGVLAIAVDNGMTDTLLLDCLAAEIESAKYLGCFLLVLDEVRCRAGSKLFASICSRPTGYRIAVAAFDPAQCFPAENEAQEVWQSAARSVDKLIILPCGNSDTAEKISAYFSTYRYLEETRTTGSNRMAFRIIPSLSEGSTIREVDRVRISVGDLSENPEGAVVADSFVPQYSSLSIFKYLLINHY